jgi:hypothetical protein
VDLVQDDPLDGRESFAELRGAQDDREALGRRDENVGRPPDLLLAFLGRRVSGSDAHPHQRLGLALLPSQLGELSQRFLEVPVDVVRERLEGRDVQAIDPVFEFASQLLRVQFVDDRQEGGKRLAAPGWGGDEDALPRVDQWNRIGLWLREILELRLEPVPDEGLHEPQDFVFRCRGTYLM